jgi:hypothetical protein
VDLPGRRRRLEPHRRGVAGGEHFRSGGAGRGRRCGAGRPGRGDHEARKSSVVVGWAAVPDADVAGYVVYRSTGSESPVRVSGAAPVTGTSFTDTTGIVGTTYRYTVAAVDTSGTESAASGAVSATPVRADVIVAADGSGHATTVQAGIDLLANNADYTAQGGRVVLVQPGTYSGVVNGGNRYGVTLRGATNDPGDVVITAGGTGTAATVTLPGRAWTLEFLTVANTTAPPAPGLRPRHSRRRATGRCSATSGSSATSRRCW